MVHACLLVGPGMPTIEVGLAVRVRVDARIGG